MQNSDCRGAVISDGCCGLRLLRVGGANEIGQPTLIEAWAGPFVGTMRDDTVGDYTSFSDGLLKLRNALSGEARLGSYEGFSLALSGNGRGAVEVKVNLVGEHVPPIRLMYEFLIDQSYLPAVICSIRREFLRPAC